MLGKPLSALCAVALACAPCVVPAASFTASNPADFQQKLNDAAANGQDDIITVEECLGAGCVTVGQLSVYDIVTPLTFTSSEGRSLTIDGVDSNTRILRGGSNNNSGILFIDTSGATDDFNTTIIVRGLTIVEGNNVGDDGGGLNIHVNLAGVEVSGSVFGGNLLEGDPFGGNAADGDGGALYIRADQAGEFPIRILDVTFDSNSAGGGGGGAHVSTLGQVEVEDVFFWDNDAANGGGLQVQGTDPNDPVFAHAASVNLYDIDFDDNIARSGNGGGADIRAGFLDVSVVGFVRNQALSGSGAGLHLRPLFGGLSIVNTGFAYNIAGNDGGGFALESNMAFSLRITNNTIYGNQASGRGAGGLLTIGGSTGLAQVYNNIIYDNTGANAGNDIYIDNDPFGDIPAAVNFFNNNITDLTGFPANASFAIVSAAELSSGSNNLGGDPLLTLMTEQDPDPHQSQNSQTIDAGDDNAPGVPNVDFEFQARPSGSAVDIGMDEYVAGSLPETDLSVTKTDSPDPVVGGQDVTYTITVTNNGPDDATGVTVVDTLDVNSTFVSAAFNQGTCTSAQSPQQLTIVTCVLGAIAANSSVPGTIVVTSSDDPQVTGIANSVTVSGNETDSTAGNNTAQQGTTVVPDTGPPQADLAVSKTGIPDPVFSGGPVLTYTITVDNNGPDAATGITLTDTLPVEAQFQSVATTAGTCETAPVNGEIDCDLGDLASGSNATVTIVVDPDDVTIEDSISNTASVGATTEDPNATNNSVTITTAVNPPAADTSVNTTHAPDSPLVNEQITYSITVVNDGPSDNTGVVLTVTLPASAMFESVSIDTGSCGDVSDGTITCTIGDMASGVRVVAQVIVTAPGETTTLTLSATLVADVEDPTPGDNVSSEAVVVIDVIDLVIEGTSEGTGSITLLELLFATIAGVAVYWHRRREAGRRVLSMLGLAAIALTLMLPAQHAVAENQWYVGASIGASDAGYSAGELQSDLTNLGWTINNPSVDDTDTAWKAYAGLSFNQYVAVEGGFADLGKVETRFGATVPPDQIGAILSDTYSIHPVLGDGWFGAVVLSWPVSPDRFSLTARAGFFAWESDIDVEVVQGGTGRVSDRDSGTDMLYGLGVEWRLNEQWSIIGEWERYELKDSVDVPSVGLKYRF